MTPKAPSSSGWSKFVLFVGWGDTVWSPEFVVRAEPNEWEASVAKSLAPRLKSLDDFYTKCVSEEVSERARKVLSHWLAMSDTSVGHDAQKVVGLYHRSPRRPRKGTNVVQLGIDGGVSVARGYIREASGVYEEGESTPELDEQIRQLFPAVQWTDIGYYINGGAEAEEINQFLDWVAKQFQAALEVDGTR